MARETFFEKKDFSRIPFKETLLAPAHAQGRLNIGKIHFCSGQIAPDGGAICCCIWDAEESAMFTNAVYGEKLVREINCKGVWVELVRCPETIWCGTVGYAPDCLGEPDIEGLLKRYQAQCGIPKQERVNPDWSCCISIDYWQNGAVPRGMCFAQQVLTKLQDATHDVYVMPESLYLRVASTAENARLVFGKEACEAWELFGFLREAMKAAGYSAGDNGAQEIEMYNHGAGMAYAYVQVKE